MVASANGVLLDQLAHPGVVVKEPYGKEREYHVRIFVRYLLCALSRMHEHGWAHLDLRPESILLNDDKLKLADFGQSRPLVNGIITGTIQGSPEFVSPEIVNGFPLTLSTDLWSVGTLTYVLLTGVSPFHGDNDSETLHNVSKGLYRTDTKEWEDFSEQAKEFVQQLLQYNPSDRPTCQEALQHPWISDKKLNGQRISADSLREFKYNHKWLERRVFVQQSPSEQLEELLKNPSTLLAEHGASRREGLPISSARPIDIYEFLRNKTHKNEQDQEPGLVDHLGRPVDEFGLPLSYRPDSGRRSKQPPPPCPGQNPIPVDRSGRFLHPEELAKLEELARQQSHSQRLRRQDVPVDQFGRPIPINRSVILDQFGRPIPPEILRKLQRPEDHTRPPPPYPQSHSLMSDRKRLEPQDKGEAPTTTRFPPPPPLQRRPEDSPYYQVPLRMIRGEHREIEEEIANRILSDISEEGSLAGSVASLEELEPYYSVRDYRQQRRYRPRSRSPSSTPRLESDSEKDESSPTLSPKTVKDNDNFNYPPSPVNGASSPDEEEDLEMDVDHLELPTKLEELDQHQKEILSQAENDPTIPVGAPLFLEALERHHPFLISESLTVEIPYAREQTQSPVSPSMKSPRSPSGRRTPKRTTPGTKSPVIHSPRLEHSMEVLIATKRGKPEFIPPGEEVPDYDDKERRTREGPSKVRPVTHKSEFEDKRDELEKIKRDHLSQKKVLDDLDKYRPKNFYKEDIDFTHGGVDIDDSPWDSHYQIGPDTYLMASRGAAFNARVRDYRREMWGDGAPFVTQGYLGYRNRDITVRERRRYTDILRESQMQLAPKTVENATSQSKHQKSNAISRIKADIEKVVPAATKKNNDGTYAPIFASRMRDVYLNPGASSCHFECRVISSPQAKIIWKAHGKEIYEDDRHKFSQDNHVVRLTILQPSAYDLGEYTCQAQNEYGTDHTSARVISGEAPNRPGRPSIEMSSDTELFMTFESPDGPTYLEGITYRVEVRAAGEDDYNAPWIIINDKVDDEAVVIKHLEPMGIYQFRVTAKNGFGCGVPSLHSRIVRTHSKGSPKLQLEQLRQTVRFNTITMPQAKSHHHSMEYKLQAGHQGLEEISEESEEADSDREERRQKKTIELDSTHFSGRFQIDQLIFSGKKSVIRCAIDNKSEVGAHCIAKIRHSPPGSEVVREFETLKQSQHENVQTLVAAYIHDNFLYLFCERLHEDVFARFCFNDHYTEEQISMVAQQIVAALHWIHFKGIAHLDVNPHNVMFVSKRSWVVKLVDFSSAQFVGSEAKVPTDLDFQWAPPEFHVEDTKVTVQSDIWGLGVTVFCLLGGFHPFTSEFDSIEDVKENVLHTKCDPNLIPVQSSQDALSFVTWSLKKSPIRRMRTDEALSHRFLSTDPSAIRRREATKYPSSKLRKTAALTKQNHCLPSSSELSSKYGFK